MAQFVIFEGVTSFCNYFFPQKKSKIKTNKLLIHLPSTCVLWLLGNFMVTTRLQQPFSINMCSLGFAWFDLRRQGFALPV